MTNTWQWKLLTSIILPGEDRDIGQNDKGAFLLMEWMLEKGLEQILPLGIVTYSERGGKTTTDLVFGSEWLREKMVSCDISQDHDHGSDLWGKRKWNG